MKVSKKTLIAATLFSAALNLHGCAYGPPPEDDTVAQIEADDCSSSVIEISSDTYIAKSNTEEVLKHE